MTGRRAALVVVLLCAALLAFYLHFRPKVHQSSLTDLRSVSPPDLINSPVQDPAAEERYERLVKLTRSLLKPGLFPASLGRDTASDVLREITRILAEGPVRRSMTRAENYDDEFTSFSRAATLIKSDAEAALARREPDRCANDLILGLKFAAAVREARGTHLGYVDMSAIEALATTAILRCVRDPEMPPGQVARVLAATTPGAQEDPVLADDWCEDFQIDVLPSLCTVEQVRKQIAELSSQYYDPQENVSGSYDAEETARTIGRIYLIGRSNALLDWLHQDSGAVKIAEAARDRVPLGARQPADGKANRLLYDLEMNASDNSIGGQLVALGVGLTPIRRMSVLIATRHDLLRAVMGIRLYRSRHAGAIPPNLDALVADRELASVPRDWFACKPLHYDAKRRFVASLGPTMRDDFDEFSHDGWTQQQDFGYFIDAPSQRKTH